MAIVIQKTEKARLTLDDAIRYQVISYCLFNRIPVIDSELQCVILLAGYGEKNLTEFCEELSEKQLFKTPQSARNAVGRIERKQLIKKEGKNQKKIMVNPGLNIQTKTPLLLNFQTLTLESDTLQTADTDSSKE